MWKAYTVAYLYTALCLSVVFRGFPSAFQRETDQNTDLYTFGLLPLAGSGINRRVRGYKIKVIVTHYWCRFL